MLSLLRLLFHLKVSFSIMVCIRELMCLQAFVSGPTMHATMDDLFPYTFPLNQIEYISFGFLSRVLVPWNKRSYTKYRREVSLSLFPSESPDYDS